MSDHREDNLPPEEIVDNTLNDLTKQIKKIRDKMSNLPPAKGPLFQPSGAIPLPPWTAEMREQEKIRLQKNEHLLKTEGLKKLDKILEGASSNVQINSYKKIYKWQEVNRSEHDAKFEKPEQKDAMSHAQEIAITKMSDRITPEPNELANENKISDERITPEVLEAKNEAILNQYNLSISYSYLKENPESSVDKTDRAKEQAMDWVDNREDIL